MTFHVYPINQSIDWLPYQNQFFPSQDGEMGWGMRRGGEGLNRAWGLSISIKIFNNTMDDIFCRKKHNKDNNENANMSIIDNIVGNVI